MSNKQALRELQSRLADRLQAARTQERAQSWLAVECGAVGFLMPLRDAGEIFAPVPIVPVPYSQPWFVGVANLRGHLSGVVDLAVFLGLADAARTTAIGASHARLVGFNASLDINCVLRVDRLAGLRGDDDLTPDAGAPGAASLPPFAGSRYTDAAGRSWQELRLAELANDEAFLKIVG